jgi:cob(I)alamin adenosyltransferase
MPSRKGVAYMPVNLTRITTKLGDAGETHLGDMSRVAKTHPRIEAYGAIDELNSHLGLTLAAGGLSDRTAAWLRRIQNELFDVGADLAVPPGDKRDRLRLTDAYVRWIETACDEAKAGLPTLRSFVQPGGTPAAAHLHVCRTICRRAERLAVAVGDTNPEVLRYLNRLSDLLFIVAREANQGEEYLWEPGKYSRG